jgi:hypothetical protein
LCLKLFSHQPVHTSSSVHILFRYCPQQALGQIGSYYQTTSDKFIHEAAKENTAESVLRSDTCNNIQ